MYNANTANPSANGIVWQPVTMAPSAKTAKHTIGRKLGAIRAFAIISIVLGVLSIFVQIAALVIYATNLYSYVYFPLDVVGHGIWCGSFYLTAGSLGVAACRKATTSLLVATVVMSALSVAGAIVASTLSGIAAANGVSYYCYYYGNSSNIDDLCDAWLGLEWALMSISILAFCSTLTLLALTSVPLCCGKRNQDRNTNVTMGIGNNQQPMYFQPHPMYAAAQQQQQLNAQLANAGQQTLYPQLQEAQFLQPTLYSQVANAPQQQAPVIAQQQQQKNQISQSEPVNVQANAEEK